MTEVLLFSFPTLSAIGAFSQETKSESLLFPTNKTIWKWRRQRETQSFCNIYFHLYMLSILLTFHFVRLASLLSKFRIQYSALTIITDVMEKAKDSTREFFDGLINEFQKKTEVSSDEGKEIQQNSNYS
jgi:hypothetical protein